MLPLVVPDTSPGPLSIMASNKVAYPLLGGPAHGKLVWFAGEPPKTLHVPDTSTKLSFACTLSTADGKPLGTMQMPPFVPYNLVNFNWDESNVEYFEWPQLEAMQRRRVVSSWLRAGFMQWVQSLEPVTTRDELVRMVAERN
jgi:hypothetical protein